MIIRDEIQEQCDYQKRDSALTLCFRLPRLFLIVFILVPLGHAETVSNDIDPINYLELTLESRSQKVNISRVAEYSNISLDIVDSPKQVPKMLDKSQTHNNKEFALNFAENVGKKPVNLLIARSPTSQICRQLWEARITSPKDEMPGKAKNELQQIIKQIKSVQFKPKDQTCEPLIIVEPIKKNETNKILFDKEMPREQKIGIIEPKLPYEKVTDQALQIFKNISQHPEQLSNPLELAEILFSSDCLTEAAKCYQLALNCMVDETDQFQNKAWIIFQIGNCLQNTDPSEALKMYKQLITRYPNSPWTDLAEAKSKLIDWYLKDKPDKLIKELK